MTPKRPWDVDTNMGKAALERFMRALVVCRGHFTDSMTLGPVGSAGRNVSLFTRVWLPDGKLPEFRQLAKPFAVRVPPRVQVGMHEWSCSECGGECPSGHCGGSEWRELKNEQ